VGTPLAIQSGNRERVPKYGAMAIECQENGTLMREKMPMLAIVLPVQLLYRKKEK
jgi:hypothetical protein